MNKLIKYFKNLLTSFLIWLKPSKIGQVTFDNQPTPLDQDVGVQQDSLEVDMDEWTDTFTDVFESDNFAVDGYEKAQRPSDEVLKRQIQLFFKDYSSFNKKVDQLYTKTIKSEK